MGKVVIPWLMVAIIVPMIVATIEQRALDKRNVPANFDYPDYSTKYDEYPVSKKHSLMRFIRKRNVHSCPRFRYRFFIFQFSFVFFKKKSYHVAYHFCNY